MKTGDKVKSLIDGKIYTVDQADNINKILRLEELSGTWNYKDFEKFWSDVPGIFIKF